MKSTFFSPFKKSRIALLCCTAALVGGAAYADTKIADSAANFGATAAARTPDAVLEVVGGTNNADPTLAKPSFLVRSAANDAASGVAGSVAPSMIVTQTGSVGVGTNAPIAKLHVENGGVTIRQETWGVYESRVAAAAASPSLVLTRSRGTLAAPTFPLSGDNLGQMRASNHNNVDSGADIVFRATEGHTATAGGGAILFRTSPNGTNTLSSNERMRIDQNGNVGIGTISPQGALDVTSTTGAFIPPRMTTAQATALSTPPTGAVIFNTTIAAIQTNTGTPAAPSWQTFVPNQVIAVQANAVQTTSNGTVLSFGQTQVSRGGTNISFNGSTTFTLQPNHTYRLEFRTGWVSGSNFVRYQWFNVGTGAAIGTTAHTEATSSPCVCAGDGTAVAYFTPSTITQVSVKQVASNGTMTLGDTANGSSFPSAQVSLVE